MVPLPWSGRRRATSTGRGRRPRARDCRTCTARHRTTGIFDPSARPSRPGRGVEGENASMFATIVLSPEFRVSCEQLLSYRMRSTRHPGTGCRHRKRVAVQRDGPPASRRVHQVLSRCVERRRQHAAQVLAPMSAATPSTWAATAAPDDRYLETVPLPLGDGQNLMDAPLAGAASRPGARGSPLRPSASAASAAATAAPS